jgi:hypothetical protein
MQTKRKATIARRVIVMLGVMAVLCPHARAANPNTSRETVDGRNRPAAKPTANVRAPAKQAIPPATVRKQTRRADPASFTPEMPFSKAIDILRRSTRPPLNIVVLWKEIGDNAGVYRETPIGIEGLPGLRVGQYLDLLLLSVSAGASAKLGYTVEKGVVVIATTDALPIKRVTRVYDISDLVAEPARYFVPMMGMGAMGLGGMLGGMPMMGSYGGGLGAGAGFVSGPSYGYGRGQGLPGLTNNLYGGTERRSGTYRRR